MDELCERAKGYIEVVEMFTFKIEVRQAGQKRDKRKGGTMTDSHKLDKQQKLDKCQPLPKGPRYECYTSLTANRTIILKEAFNEEVPIKLSLPLPP